MEAVAESNEDQEDTFAAIIKIVEESKRKPLKNSRVQSFSPVTKGKESFGLYYDQKYPDSAESRIKTKPMTFLSKKNLKDYKIPSSARDSKLKYSVPIYNKNTIQLATSRSKGVLTTSNFSNNDKKGSSSKEKSTLMKWNTSQIKYKNKKGSDNSIKSPHSKYTTNYSSKRPKSAKGTGIHPKQEYSYKYSYHKGNSSGKYPSSKKRNDTSSQLRKNQGIKDITTKSK